tara:strand:- start:221 stop:601 length:381 start_codon:yes stop_codon:yes gene_type:complete
MARTLEQIEQPTFQMQAPPPFTTSFHDWAETKLSYPREIYKGEYYILTGSQEDHYKRLRAGWSDERPDDHPYKPWTSSPEAQQLAQRGMNDLRAKRAAESAEKTPTVTKDLIAQMIEDKFKKELGQ